MTQVLPPAGWYVDPNGPTQERYWNGSAWTEQTRPNAPTPPPPPPPQPQVAEPYPARHVPAPSYGGTPTVGSVPPVIAPPRPNVMAGPPSRSRGLRHPVLTGIGVLVAIIVIASVATSGNDSTSPTADTSTSAGSVTGTTDNGSTTGTSNGGSVSRPKPAAPQYTVAEESVLRSAKAYLDMAGFSRAGLIEQLSSKAGEGYSMRLAVFAVDHVKVNWKHEAVESARAYLQMTGFSRAGLIEQLSSKAGDEFTLAQAKYAVKKVGL